MEENPEESVAVIEDNEGFMRMEVSAEESRHFNELEGNNTENEMEKGETEDSSDDEGAFEESVARDDDNIETNLDDNESITDNRNSNANRYEKRQQEDFNKEEEMKFMKRFALFMEDQGYIQKKDDNKSQVEPSTSEWKNSKSKKQTNHGDSGNLGKGDNEVAMVGSESELTLYNRAVEVSLHDASEPMRMLTSSDEFNDTSDESIESMNSNDQNAYFEIVDQDVSIKRKDQIRWKDNKHNDQQRNVTVERTLTPKEKAEQRVKDAEKAKACLLQVQGKDDLESNKNGNDLSKKSRGEGPRGNLVHSVLVDEEYSAIASHLDDVMRKNIMLGEYVDFVRLLPKDRVLAEEDQRMEMVNRGELTYWVPVSSRHSATVSNIAKWEETFRIFFTSLHRRKSN